MSLTFKVVFLFGVIALFQGVLWTDAADPSEVVSARSLGLTVVLGDKQYYVGVSQKISWYRAIQICAIRNMTLTAIESDSENTNLENYLFANFILGAKFWISGTDLANIRQYTWLASGSNFNYTNWATGQPQANNNNRNRCVVTNSLFNWATESCASEHYFICSRPTVPSCGAKGTCLYTYNSY